MKKINETITDVEAVTEYRYLFLRLLSVNAWYSIGLAFRPGSYIEVSNNNFNCSRGGKYKVS